MQFSGAASPQFQPCDVIVVLDGSFPLSGGSVAHWGSAILLPATGEELQSVDGASRILAMRGLVARSRLPQTPGAVRITRDVRIFAVVAAALSSRERSRVALTIDQLVKEPPKLSLPRDHAPWLDEVRNLLHQRYASALRMRTIADHVGKHHVHVSRAFVQAFGITMSDYVRDLRIARACELLLTTPQQLSRIAHGTGFSDHAHFTRVFSAVIGSTPSRYRLENGALAHVGSPLYLYRCEPELSGDPYAHRGRRGSITVAAS